MTIQPHTLEPEVQAVLDYWCLDDATGRMDIPKGKLWFMGGKAVDEYLKTRFGNTLQQARHHELDSWLGYAEGALALIILLDQFNRNINRGTGQAFAGDEKALAVCLRALDKGFHQQINHVQRLFCYLPLTHNESAASQARSVQLFEDLAADAPSRLSEFTSNTLKSAIEHKAIIDQFGRYPHRNAALGRTSTAAEEQWLNNSGKRFGQ